ncbi:hypothetical protein CEUSTIGMA_g13079.t1 [Chlamydomonas eustigma]|uniref:Uncharacterized protein n=1 Tax=Chlamydomonas eustigma TaxID=1157962 RepID=A0A250XRI0_9CHLO|nr:hypothetical protein CEUSTIGMA_g13079.t1 [Chlamydomonas eustigma]|eukprot:GAX85664.1 hypothetical protein CEUSTIGMA_g13079.t1 [Chlamydomonas eustigma]
MLYGHTARHFAPVHYSATSFSPRIKYLPAHITSIRSASDGSSLFPNSSSSTSPLPSTSSSPQLSTPSTSSSTHLNGSNGDAASGGIKQQLTVWERVKEWFSGDKYKEKMASMGMAAFLSYGVVSNVT